MSTVTKEDLHYIHPELVEGGKKYKDANADISRPLESFPTKTWGIALAVSIVTFSIFLAEALNVVGSGMGRLGLNIPVGWGSFIINFVFWIGIGHAGTLISAILYVFRQQWRTGINRAAEAMTIFSVLTAAFFVTVHVGRTWVIFWALPYPNERGVLWPNFRSPLTWDEFAISTYFITSLVFWYIGLIPDFASIRDRIVEDSPGQKIRKVAYSILSFGWVGSTRAWAHYEAVVMILSGLSMPLVFSVHSIVSFDFATSVIPGWHATIFPPYFVLGAVFSGFGMVLTLLIIMREVFRLTEYITVKHLENMAKICTLTGSLVGLAYATEFFIAWYGGSEFEAFAFINRAFGPYWWSYWIMVSCNVISPQLFWFKKIRTNPVALWIISIFINIGMWFERFVIIVTSLHRDYIPSSWDMYVFTPHDWIMLFGSFGMFFTMFLLFARFFPTIAIAEIKATIKSPDAKGFGH